MRVVGKKDIPSSKKPGRTSPYQDWYDELLVAIRGLSSGEVVHVSGDEIPLTSAGTVINYLRNHRDELPAVRTLTRDGDLYVLRLPDAD